MNVYQRIKVVVLRVVKKKLEFFLAIKMNLHFPKYSIIRSHYL